MSLARTKQQPKPRRSRWVVAALCGAMAVGASVYGVAVASADTSATISDYLLSKPPHFKTVQRDYRTLYPAGEGAQSYDDLNRIEKTGVDGIRAYYGSVAHGRAVHQKYKEGSLTRIRYSKLRRAQREAGLGGVADLGVR